MNYLEPILEFIYRIVRLVFRRKQKKKSAQPAGNPDPVTDPAQPVQPGDEPAGSDPGRDRSDPDPLPAEPSDEQQPTLPDKAGQTTVNLTGWCLILVAGITKWLGNI